MDGSFYDILFILTYLYGVTDQVYHNICPLNCFPSQLSNYAIVLAPMFIIVHVCVYRDYKIGIIYIKKIVYQTRNGDYDPANAKAAPVFIQNIYQHFSALEASASFSL